MRNEWFLEMRWPEKHPSPLFPLFYAPHSVSPTLPLPPPLSHPPTDALPPTHSLLRALDEYGGLIAFFRERISMSCPECSGLMHKEQAQKWGAGESQTLPPLANQSHSKVGWPKPASSGRTLIGEQSKSACCWTRLNFACHWSCLAGDLQHQNLHADGHI